MIVIKKQQIFTCLRRDIFAKYSAMIVPFLLNNVMIRFRMQYPIVKLTLEIIKTCKNHIVTWQASSFRNL